MEEKNENGVREKKENTQNKKASITRNNNVCIPTLKTKKTQLTARKKTTVFPESLLTWL
jgi:hypothetical protein